MQKLVLWILINNAHNIKLAITPIGQAELPDQGRQRRSIDDGCTISIERLILKGREGTQAVDPRITRNREAASGGSETDTGAHLGYGSPKGLLWVLGCGWIGSQRDLAERERARVIGRGGVFRGTKIRFRAAPLRF